MPYVPDLRAMTRACLIAIVLAVVAASVVGSAAADPAKPAKKAPAVAAPSEPEPPVVGDTRANLQKAFANEMNAKERYSAFAKQAAREGHPAAAQLFLACAQAEQVHADRHVHALAMVGGEARVLLDRVAVGTTAENLQTAIQAEKYEVEVFYPAFLERARADSDPDAVRAMTFALSAEREHQKLLVGSLASLEEHAAAPSFHVCSYCGKTVESIDFKKCPNCFTDAGKFIQVGEEEVRPAASLPAAPGVPAGGRTEPIKPPAPPEPRK